MPDPVELPSTEAQPVGPTIGGDQDSSDWGKLDSMLNELPSGIPILPSADAQNFAKYRYKPSLYPKDEAWKICTNAMEKYDGEICKAYRDELDALLVFAGLFSAVITGFTVESYQWLQDNPSDAMIPLLVQIAQSVGPNGTAAFPPSSSGMGSSVSARINAYWFVSLALSLSAALVSILAKQWVREFERRASDMTPQEIVGVRQLKFEGLKHWRVEDIISTLPMLLQFSLALFATGVLELLWQLNTAVAVAVCVPTMAALLFYSVTTILPALQYSQQFRYALPLCAYKSPQSLLAVRLYQLVSGARTFSWEYFQSLFRSEPDEFELMTRGSSPSDIEAMAQEYGWTQSWNVWDRGFYVSDRHSTSLPMGCSHFRGLHWLLKTMDERNTKEAVWTCLWKEANSPDAHITDRQLSQYPERREAWLRRGLLDQNVYAPETLSRAPLWQCPMLSLPRTNMARESVSEMLIHCLPSMDASTAEHMFTSFSSRFSDDPELVSSLVRAVVSYGRQHIYDDISRVISLTSSIVANCSDPGTQSALQWTVVTLAMNWLSLRPGTMLQTPTALALDMLSRSPEDFIRYPQRLHDLPHIAAVAGLLKAAYEAGAWRRLTWPIFGGFGQADLLRFTRDHELVIHEERLPMVLELFKISICGVDRAADAPGTSRARRDSLVPARWHADTSPNDVVPASTTPISPETLRADRESQLAAVETAPGRSDAVTLAEADLSLDVPLDLDRIPLQPTAIEAAGLSAETTRAPTLEIVIVSQAADRHSLDHPGDGDSADVHGPTHRASQAHEPATPSAPEHRRTASGDSLPLARGDWHGPPRLRPCANATPSETTGTASWPVPDDQPSAESAPLSGSTSAVWQTDASAGDMIPSSAEISAHRPSVSAAAKNVVVRGADSSAEDSSLDLAMDERGGEDGSTAPLA